MDDSQAPQPGNDEYDLNKGDWLVFVPDHAKGVFVPVIVTAAARARFIASRRRKPRPSLRDKEQREPDA